MIKTIGELADAVIQALYATVKRSLGDTTDGDTADDPFVAWCKPGIPFEAEDFRFARYLMQGQGETVEARQADALLQLTQAAGFSRFVDFVPSVNGVVMGNTKEGVLRPGSATLSEFYKRILGSADVAELANTADESAKIAQLESKAEPLLEKYFQYKDEYSAANEAYVDLRIKSTWSTLDGLAFQSKGLAFKTKRDDAKAKWEVLGKKNQYNDIQAQITSLRNKRSPAIWLAEALARFNDIPEGQNAVFGEARITIPYPGGFAQSPGGWSNFSFETSHVEKLDQTTHTTWKAGGGIKWSSLKLGGGASSSTDTALHINNTDGFTIKMEVAQIPLIRQWFDPWFLRSEFWRFKPGSIEAESGDVVSDGGSPPKGLAVGYPVTAIFVRDVQITLAELKDTSSELYKTLKVDGGGGWGLGALSIKGGYERNGEVKTQKSTVDKATGTLTVEGLQLVGFMCEEVGMSPDPKEGLTWLGGQ